MSAVLSESPAFVSHDRLLTPKQAAEVLGVGRDYVYALVNSGELASKKIGHIRRIWMSDLRAWVDSH